MSFPIRNLIRNFRGFFYSVAGLLIEGQTEDNDVLEGDEAVLFYRSDTGALRLQRPEGTFADLATTDDVGAALAVPACIPVVLSKHSNGSVAARFTPGFAGKLRKISASVTDPVTTAAKLGTFTSAIAGTPVTGGALALTSANCTPVGAKIDGSAITALNTFAATDEITIAASAVTAFVEGQVVIYLFVDAV